MLSVKFLFRCSCIAMVAVSMSHQAGAQVRVRAVDLFGAPVEGVDVRLDDNGTLFPAEPNKTDRNGLAVIGVEPIRTSGSADIRINMANEEERVKSAFREAPIGFIGRVKEVRWRDKDEFNEGFAVPLWAPGDVKSLADAVIRNPDHIAVAIQLGSDNGAGSRVIAEIDRDVDSWIANVVPDLPEIRDPYLARDLFAQADPGQVLPPHFDESMRKVFAEVQRQNDATRVCRMFPQGVPQPNPGPDGNGRDPDPPWPPNPDPPRLPPNHTDTCIHTVHYQPQVIYLPTVLYRPIYYYPPRRRLFRWFDYRQPIDEPIGSEQPIPPPPPIPTISQ